MYSTSELDELFQILNLIEKDLNLKGLEPHWSNITIETNDIDNDFLRDYENMHKSMEDRQINDFYEARRHIQSTMMGDTPVKTVQNRQCIDNMSDYDSDHHRISKSVCHRLDLGPISLLGAQQHTTVESAAALKRQDKIEGKFKAHIQSDNGRYRMKCTKGQKI